MPSSENEVSSCKKRRKSDKSATVVNNCPKSNKVKAKDLSNLVHRDQDVAKSKELDTTTSNLKEGVESFDPCVKSELPDVTEKSENIKEHDDSSDAENEGIFLNNLLEDILFAKQQALFSCPEVLSELRNQTEKYQATFDF